MAAQPDNTIRTIAHNACTGCGACRNKCPKDAIRMVLDGEGFYFPQVTDACVNCGLCLAACPAAHPVAHHPTPPAYAVWADDDTRMKSSSGGMFSLLAEATLAKGGAVCGAAYDDDFMTVHHVWAENREALAPLRSSKYVQSDTELTYRQAKAYLEAGRPVLYTGCPCQIAGLYRFLGKDYPNLLTADLICHGANSLTAYQSFLREFSEGKPIAKVDFRDKTYFGWATTEVVRFKDGSVKKAPFEKATWYAAFLKGLINRLCCHSCPYACAERVADLTLGDFWRVSRIDPAYHDGKETSLVLANSAKGRAAMDGLRPSMKLCAEVPLEEARKYNGQLNHPQGMHPWRKLFFNHLAVEGFHKALWWHQRRKKFDIGIVGWWFGSNHGSALTYYALGTILQQRDREVLFVPIGRADGQPWDPGSKQTVAFIAKRFAVGHNRPYGRMHEFNRFCEAFLLGSDQMWRVGTLRLVGYAFFLDFVARDKKKIAFASSFGGSQFPGTPLQIATAGDFLRRFDAISVREQSGVEICERTFGIQAECVIDPVFLCPRNDYDRLTRDIADDPPRKPYLLCYILDPTEAKERAAKALAERLGVEIITALGISEYNSAVTRWHTGTVLPNLQTERFLWYIRHCAFMLTDSHHGTCFAILYHKPYAALVNVMRGRTRFESVAQALGLEERLFEHPEDVIGSERPYRPIDWEAVERRLDAERGKAFAWLDRALAAPTTVAEETVNTAREEGRREGGLWLSQSPGKSMFQLDAPAQRPRAHSKPSLPQREAEGEQGAWRRVRGAAKQCVPYGLMRKWLRCLYGIEIGRPFSACSGLGERAVHALKSALPYGVVLALEKDAETRRDDK